VEAPPGVRMVRRTILDISKVGTIGFVNSLALDSTEIIFFEESSAKADTVGGQRARWAEMHTSSEGAAVV
jgi:hypothetical protein